MTVLEVKEARQALLDGVARLVDEYDDHPAGVVMRCYARAVHLARAAGCPPSELPGAVERRTRVMLAARRGTIAWTPVLDEVS